MVFIGVENFYEASSSELRARMIGVGVSSSSDSSDRGTSRQSANLSLDVSLREPPFYSEGFRRQIFSGNISRMVLFVTML